MAVNQAVDFLQAKLAGAAQPFGPEGLTPSGRRRKERMEVAHQLHHQGWTQKSIATHLDVRPKTIRRDLRNTIPVLRRRSRQGQRRLDPFKGYLLKRWNERCHNAAQLFREILPQGYAGKLTTVRDDIQCLRQASGLPKGSRSQPGRRLDGDPTDRPPSLRSLTWLMIKPPERRLPEDERLLAQLVADHPKLTTTLNLTRQFAEIVRQQQPDKLDNWLTQASDSGFQIWKNFATSLRQDYQAVRAALVYEWSSGVAEGHVNRLKTIKSSMYGRAKFDLLRLRVLSAA